MPKSTVHADDYLALIFHTTAIANLAQNNATSPATNMSIALHTASPTITGTQLSSEISYTGYARVNVTRALASWPISGAATADVSPAANIDFGEMTAGTGGTVTFMSIGTSPSTTANKLIYFGAVAPVIVVANGVTPRLTTATTITET